jgi:hypothetical protein
MSDDLQAIIRDLRAENKKLEKESMGRKNLIRELKPKVEQLETDLKAAKEAAGASLDSNGKSYKVLYEETLELVSGLDEVFGEEIINIALENPDSIRAALGDQNLIDVLSSVPELRTKAEINGREPSEWEAKYKELAGKQRELTHKQKFQEIAKQNNIRDDAFDDAYALSGYKAESDDVDETALTELVANLAKSKPFLLKTPEATPAPASVVEAKLLPPKALSKPVGSGRGNPDTESRLLISRTNRDLSNPEFMRANQKAISQGNFVMVD